MLYFVIANSVLLNLCCVWILVIKTSAQSQLLTVPLITVSVDSCYRLQHNSEEEEDSPFLWIAVSLLGCLLQQAKQDIQVGQQQRPHTSCNNSEDITCLTTVKTAHVLLQWRQHMSYNSEYNTCLTTVKTTHVLQLWRQHMFYYSEDNTCLTTVKTTRLTTVKTTHVLQLWRQHMFYNSEDSTCFTTVKAIEDNTLGCKCGVYSYASMQTCMHTHTLTHTCTHTRTHSPCMHKHTHTSTHTHKHTHTHTHTHAHARQTPLINYTHTPHKPHTHKVPDCQWECALCCGPIPAGTAVLSADWSVLRSVPSGESRSAAQHTGRNGQCLAPHDYSIAQQHTREKWPVSHPTWL